VRILLKPGGTLVGAPAAEPLRLPRRDSSRRSLPGRAQDSTGVSRRQEGSLRQDAVRNLTEGLL
jgi:hypothetical protein